MALFNLENSLLSKHFFKNKSPRRDEQTVLLTVLVGQKVDKTALLSIAFILFFTYILYDAKK
jgi:hypothetical protein